jgi:agmatinase
MPKYHFLECGINSARDPRAPYAVLPIPYERTVCFGRGTAKAPGAILKASLQMESFDEEFFRPLGLRVQTLPAIKCRGTGVKTVFSRIRNAAEAVMMNNRFLMSLGGEHSITVPLAEAARSVHGKDICVLNLDSHLDLRDCFNNSLFSHGCVFRRIMDMHIPVIHAGIRSLCREEYDLVRRNHLDVFWARDIHSTKNDNWIRAIVRRLKKKVYLSIDIDVLDPSIMPGTGTPEPGGLAWHTVLKLLRQVCLARKVVAADIVEVIPLPDIPVCEYVAAKLALKVMTYCSGNFR